MTISTNRSAGTPREQRRVPDHREAGQELTASTRASLNSASLSVVVPTFNDVGRIGDALTSIVNQTLPPAEIVVSDDGSDDATEQFVRDFAARHEAEVVVRYVRLASRSGVVAARNHGISVARGEWIAECDSDDVWAPTKLERQAQFVREWRGRQRIALLGTHGYNMNDAKRVISRAIMGPTTEADFNSLRETGGLFFVIHSSVLFHRSDFSLIGGYSTEYGAADEFDFFSRMAERGVVINMPEPLVYYRKRAGSMQLDRFWDKEQGALRVGENQRRRVTGRAPIGPEEFAALLASAPAWVRFKRRKRALGMYYYRSGAARTVNGRRVLGGFELLLAGLLDPALVRAGVLNVLRSRLSRESSAREGEPLDTDSSTRPQTT
jgi:glycosyltransferase involved in cell wall biosynthesis